MSFQTTNYGTLKFEPHVITEMTNYLGKQHLIAVLLRHSGNMAQSWHIISDMFSITSSTGVMCLQ